MHTTLRRLRGLVITALLWAPVWALAGAAMAVYQIQRMHRWHRMYRADGSTWPTDFPMTLDGWGWTYLGEKALAFAIAGAMSGAVFALVVVALERRWALGQLAMGRMAAWGALGGMTIPFVVLGTVLTELGRFPGGGAGRDWLVMTASLGALGAICSAATLAAARRPVTTHGGT
jgi:hypothetical protein